MAKSASSSFRLTPELKAALVACSARLDRSEAWIIEKALTQFLRDRGCLPKDDQTST